MGQNKLPFWILILTSLVFSVANAGERREFYNGTRALGMGGAGIAVVNDETALLVNPAALGKLRDPFITIADPEIDIGAETQAIIGSDVMMFMDPQEVLEALDEPTKNDKRFHQRVQVFPSLVFPNFGIGLYAEYGTDAFIDEDTGDFNLYYEENLAGVVGFNFRLFDGKIKLGFNAKYINRTIADVQLPTSSTGLKMEDIASEGVGVSTDVGLILTGPWKWLPTLAVVYRDAGNTFYDVNDGMFWETAERPTRTKATLDAGFAIFPILGNKTRFTFTGEMKDVMNSEELEIDEDDPSRRIHGGMELNIYDSLFIRAGMNQRYWTAGFEFAIPYFQLQATTYGEEVGTADDTAEDRRYNIKFSWRF